MEKDTIDFIKKYNDVIGNPFPENSMYSATRLINTLHRFKSIMNDNCPALSLDEWCTCVATGEHYEFDVTFAGKKHDTEVLRVCQNIMANPLECQRWGVDGFELGARIYDMTYTQQCAVYNVIITFWSLRNRVEFENWTDLLTYCGANISD